MPWHVTERDGKYCVVKDSDGSEVKCHPTREEALAHMRALYANDSPSGKAIEDGMQSSGAYIEAQQKVGEALSVRYPLYSAPIPYLWSKTPGPHVDTLGNAPEDLCVVLVAGRVATGQKLAGIEVLVVQELSGGDKDYIARCEARAEEILHG